MVKTLISSSKKILSREHSSILSAAAIIGAFTLLAAGLGLIRNRMLAAYFFGGLEGQLDVYFAAFVVPDTVFQLLVTGALSAAFIPIYSAKLRQSETEANHLANATLNIMMLGMIVVTALLIIFARPVSHLVANFPVEQTELLASLMRIMLVSQLFFGVSSFMTGIIQSHQRFLVPALAPVFYNASIIGGTMFAPSLGIYGPAYGVVVGAFLHMLVQIPLAKSLGFKFKFVFDPGNRDLQLIGKLMGPRTAALAVGQVERWISVYFASLFAAGYLTMFNFARQLYVLPVNLFGVALGQAALPRLSAEAANEELADFRRTLSEAILQIFFFALPISVLFLVLRIPIVRIVFGARPFPWEATLLTGRTLALFTLSIAPQAAAQILVRAFYALKNTRLPLAISVITVGAHLILTIVFAVMMNLNIMGLALAMTVSNTLGAVLLLAFLERRIGDLGLYPKLFQMILVTFLTGLALWIPLRILDQLVFDTTRTVPLIILTTIAGGLGLAVYLGLSKLMNIAQLDAVVRLVHKWSNWRVVLSRSSEVIEPSPPSNA
jgi:putative peptidoglycan lipid II flippase